MNSIYQDATISNKEPFHVTQTGYSSSTSDNPLYCITKPVGLKCTNINFKQSSEVQKTFSWLLGTSDKLIYII